MKAINKQPKIRFKGFTDAWEQRDLGNITKLITKGTTPLDKKSNGSVNFIKVESIDKVSGEINIQSKISLKEHEGYLRRSKLENDDILFSIAGTLGRIAVVKEHMLPANTNQALAIIRLKYNNVDYVKTYLKGKSVQDYIRKNPTVGAQPNLSLEQVANMSIKLPGINEQLKLSQLFINLDSSITLHQRKCEELKLFKKSMLAKMFPKEGESVPEVRFSGFTGEWKECEVKDICSIETGKSNTQDQDCNGIYPFYIRSDIPVKSNKYLYDEEAVITVGDGKIGSVFHYINGKFDLHQRCYKMADFNNVLGKYFYYYFSSNFYKRAMKMTAKATVDSVRLEMISDMIIKYPINKNEQKVVANFFTYLDDMINLHQQKVENLQNIKKSLLDNMFV